MNVVIHTNYGDITLNLFQEEAPVTCENFLTYCKESFYDNTLFHRVIDGFMIQGGGMTPELEDKPTHKPIKNEANNGLKNKLGTVAMARTSEPHSASSQFFINVADNSFLDYKSETVSGWGYCVFAEVIEGMDIVDNIKKVKTGFKGMHQDVPVDNVIIHNITIL